MEKNNYDKTEVNSMLAENNNEVHTPKLFIEEQNYKIEDEEENRNSQDFTDEAQLFDQDISEEDDFEIPAFLRKQKF